MIEQTLCPVVVGREEEIGAVEDVVVGAVRGEGGAVMLTGDAGVGKSRAAAEVTSRAARIGVCVLRGNCPEASLTVPYVAVVEAVSRRLAQLDLGPLRNRLGALAPALGTLFPQLAEGPRERPHDAEGRAALFEAMVALLDALANDHGVLLVIEDLHWADDATRELLDYIVRRCQTLRLAVLMTARLGDLDRHHPLHAVVRGWRRSRLAEVMNLEGLDGDGVARMVQAILGIDAVSEEFAHHLLDRSGGNPFAVEELVKDALDRGDIFRIEDHWERRPLTELRLPPSVVDAILLRVDDLGPSALAVLQAAAVVGGSVSRPLLVAVTRLPSEEVEDAVAEGVRRQLLEPAPGDASRIVIRQTLTRHVVAESLVPSQRRSLHARAADALIAGRTESPEHDALAGDIARHLLAAGRGVEAVPLCLEAADDAMRRFAPLEAAEICGQALQHVTDQRGRGRLLCRTAEALFAANDPGAALQRCLEGIALLTAAGEIRAAAREQHLAGRCHWAANRLDEARRAWEDALAVLLGPPVAEADADEPTPDPVAAELLSRLATLHQQALEGAEMEHAAARALEIAVGAGSTGHAAEARCQLGLSLIIQGRVAAGARQVARGVAEAVACGQAHRAALLNLNTAASFEIAWRIPDMRAALERVDERVAPPWLPIARGALHSLAMLAAGDIAPGLEGVRRWLEGSQRHGYRVWEADAHIALVHALVELDELDDASTTLEGAEITTDRRETLIRLWWTQMRLAQAVGDGPRAAQVARAVLMERGWSLPAWLVEEAASQLIGAGDLGEAARVLDDRAALFSLPAHAPTQQRLAGRLALAGGDPVRAVEYLEGAVVALADQGMSLESARTRIDVAMAWGAGGDEEAARWALAAAEEFAAGRGAVRLLREVAEARDALHLATDEYLTRGPAPTTASATAPGGRHPQSFSGPPADAGVDGLDERLVTVLFADVRGYTEIAGRSAPHDLADRIATFHRWAAREVERRGGAVDKYAGDAMMAVFNLGHGHVDHPVRALDAALALRARTALIGLPVGMGIAVGPAIVGRLVAGANLSVLGEATNLAARLQAHAGAGEVLLSEEAHRRLRERLAQTGGTTEAVQLDLKGFAGQVTAHRLRAR